MDLSRVSVDVARAIVVLATAESPERSDARVLRIVLSLMGVHDRLKKSGIEGGLKVVLLLQFRIFCMTQAVMQVQRLKGHYLQQHARVPIKRPQITC